MLPSSAARLLAMLADDAVVLDVGGWADPFDRADWVLDVMPYETRGLYERRGWTPSRSRDSERFTAQTWIQRDICAREPFPFADDEIDFAICSQTLEDVRDPVWVCQELARVARAGYVEVPSRLAEQSWGVEGRFVGWGHHRWLIDVGDQELQFVHKPHTLHSRREHHFPPGFWGRLSEEERVQTLWWEGTFAARERIMLEPRESDDYLGGFVAQALAQRSGTAGRGLRLRRRGR